MWKNIQTLGYNGTPQKTNILHLNLPKFRKYNRISRWLLFYYWKKFKVQVMRSCSKVARS